MADHKASPPNPKAPLYRVIDMDTGREADPDKVSKGPGMSFLTADRMESFAVGPGGTLYLLDAYGRWEYCPARLRFVL